MRKELIEIERIENYLMDTMNLGEKAEFELEMKGDDSLKNKVDAQQQVMNAVEKMALKKSVEESYRSYKMKALLTKALLVLAGLAIAGFVALQFMVKGEGDFESSENIGLVDSLSSQANLVLDENTFIIKTNQDTVIENQDDLVDSEQIDSTRTNNESKLSELHKVIELETIEKAPVVLKHATQTSNTIYDLPIVNPEFPGGNDEMREFIAKNFVVPDNAGISGTVYVSFTVGEDGSINDAKVMTGLSNSIDKEALRVVKKMPKWKPAEMNGGPVSVSYTIPIKVNTGFQTIKIDS